MAQNPLQAGGTHSPTAQKLNEKVHTSIPVELSLASESCVA